MLLVSAIVESEKVSLVLNELASAGIFAITKTESVDSVEDSPEQASLPTARELLMVAHNDGARQKIVDLINRAAHANEGQRIQHRPVRIQIREL